MHTRICLAEDYDVIQQRLPQIQTTGRKLIKKVKPDTLMWKEDRMTR